MSKKFIDLSGKMFGSLTVIKPIGRDSNGGYIWECRCDCGENVSVMASNLTRKHTRSCGCLVYKTNTKHGMRGTNIYGIWKQMLHRCNGVNCKEYKYYGARGIKVCREWYEFENFYRDMGEKPKGMSIDRIDVNGDYCKENCRWATTIEQANNKTNSKYITYNGKRKTLRQWSSEKNINFRTLANRIYTHQWSFEKAINTPVGHRKERKYS